jgi:hypothetical protein
MKSLLKLFALLVAGGVGYAIVDPQGFESLMDELGGGSVSYDRGGGPTMEAYDRRDRERYVTGGEPYAGPAPPSGQAADPFSNMSPSELRRQRDQAYAEFTALQRNPRVNSDPNLRNRANYWYNQYLLYDRSLKARQQSAR